MRRNQSGMSLVEVLVAVAIGLIGMLVITQAYVTGDRFNRSTLGESGAQTNGLIGLYSIERDLRSSGYGIADAAALGCGQLYWYYNGKYSTNIQPTSTLPPVTVAPVFIKTDTTAPFTDPDEVTVMFATGGNRMLPGSIKVFSAASNKVTLDAWAGFNLNDMVLLMGSSGCTLSRITNVDKTFNEFQLNPSASAPQNVAGWGLFPVSYGTGDLIMNLGNPVVRTYSVAGGRLRVADSQLQTGALTPVDLMDGIVDLRAQYGKDNGINNGTVSAASYVANDARVDQFSNTAPASSAEWQQVLSVRIAVLARIGEYERPTTAGANCDATTSAPAWSGGTFSALDIATPTSQDRCYRYRVFETTIPLRNMVWRAT